MLALKDASAEAREHAPLPRPFPEREGSFCASRSELAGGGLATSRYFCCGLSPGFAADAFFASSGFFASAGGGVSGSLTNSRHGFFSL